MASRIHETIEDGYKTRCHEMKGYSSDVIRWNRDFVNNSTLEPIIAKGNRFDGVEAIY